MMRQSLLIRQRERELDAKMRQRQREYETPNTLKHLLFAFEGRISRIPFLVTVFALWGVFLAIMGLSSFFMIAIQIVHEHLAFVVGLILGLSLLIFALWVSLAVTIKRLHDCDLSGWWCVMFFILSFALTVVGKSFFRLDQGDNATAQEVKDAVTGISCLIIHLLVIIVLGSKKGTEGENRFGQRSIMVRWKNAKKAD